ncbi:hypothetical protein ACRALDRAFT_2043058 [Sodiomyces alcalophilus JCM 7366]|uniref:uncharacterized protein n=1 Tax=Sodiomyces alcalophilus JCM 7366 TaxID=591952 RepID=UPI0039B51035
MLVSYINGARAEGRKHFRRKLPTIFKIQDLIEEAWDRGINAQSRSETGGIRGTRKYIGTSEAQAFFRVLEIPCTAQAFADPDPVKVHRKLIESVESYFAGGSSGDASKVRCTTLPPIYFQHAGHSLTIVGFEKQKHGPSNLLVFDPSRRDSPSVSRLAGYEFRHKSPDEPLKAYRRGPRYLWRYQEFEMLM